MSVKKDETGRDGGWKSVFSISESEDSEEEHENIPKQKKVMTTKNGAILHLIKANVGTGILAMPKGISHSGILAGAIGLVLLGIVCTYCMHVLVTCSKIMASKLRKEERKKDSQNRERIDSATSETNRISSITDEQEGKNAEDFEVEESSTEKENFNRPDENKNSDDQDIEAGKAAVENENVRSKSKQSNKEWKSPSLENKDRNITYLDYATTAQHAFGLCPSRVRKMAPCIKFTVNLCLVITQFGFCCVYILFVAESLREVAKHFEVMSNLTVFYIMLLELPVMIALNFISNLSKLQVFTSTAVVLQTTGLIIMTSYFLKGESSETIIPFFAPIAQWPLYFGTAMFAFEGIAVVLPLENDMKRKSKFQSSAGVLNVSMCFVTILYIIVGISGYIKYGTDVKSSITFNLPIGCVSELVRIMFAISIFFSYPLQMYVPFSFILPYLKKKLIRDSYKGWVKYVIECGIRTTIVIFTFAVAISVPMLELVISFVGAFSSNSLALIFPPIIQIVTIWESNIRHKKWIIGFDIFISLFAFFGLLMGSSTAAVAIWDKFKNGNATK